jgi:hypothetical protein
MRETPKPRRVKAKITRRVTEIAVVLLDREGNVEEVEEVHEEIDYDVPDLHDIRTVLSVHE